MFLKSLGVIVMVLFMAGVSNAMLPLVTDDTGTQGKGKFQLETSIAEEHEEGRGVKEDVTQPRLAVTFGMAENVDIICTIPFLYVRTKANGAKSIDGWISDVTLETKWRFFESDGLSFALKPGLSFPSGDSNTGLGAGQVGGSLFLIATKEIDPVAFHFNVGYIRNENDLDEGVDIWHVSTAIEWKALKWLKIVADVGGEGGREREINTPQAFILGGLVFSVSESVDLDLGIRGNFADSSTGYSLLAGATFRF